MAKESQPEQLWPCKPGQHGEERTQHQRHHRPRREGTQRKFSPQSKGVVILRGNSALRGQGGGKHPHGAASPETCALSVSQKQGRGLRPRGGGGQGKWLCSARSILLPEHPLLRLLQNGWGGHQSVLPPHAAPLPAVPQLSQRLMSSRRLFSVHF